MTIRHRCLAGVLACSIATILAVGSSQGQPPMPEPLPTDLGKKLYKDPTLPDAALKGILTGSKTGPGTTLPKQQDLRLRGRVISKERSAVILEIDGQTFMLPVGGEARSVKVKAITADAVTVEVGLAKDVKMLH